MERVTFNVTCRCNLKCRLCGAYIPYLRNGKRSVTLEYPIEHWQIILKQYFRIVSQVNVVAISGGEPLLYANLAAFIRCLKQYENAIGRVQIVTNGTIVPSQDVVEAVMDFGEKIYFNVDNYGTELSAATEKMEELFQSKNISYILRNYTRDNPHCGGWVDFGGLTKRIHNTTEQQEQVFAKCANAQKIQFCFLIAGREMWPCDPARRRSYLEDGGNDSEYIDLLDDSLSISQQQEKIRAIYQMRSLSACAYCNGLCEDSVRVIPGEQLTSEEMQCIKAGARSYEEVLSMLRARQM